MPFIPDPPSSSSRQSGFIPDKPSGFVPDAPPKKRNVFESPASRMLFPGVGQVLGTVAGGTLGAAAGGIGAVPGGLTGAVTGAGAGEALREGLSRFIGGGVSNPRAFQRIAEESALGAVGEATGPALKAVGRGIAKATPPTIARVGQLVTRIPSDAIRRAIDRGPKKILTPEKIQTGLVPETIDRVVNGMEAFREGSETAYRQGIKELQPLYADRRVNFGNVAKRFRVRLTEAKVIDEFGKPIKPIITEATEITRTHKKLAAILQRFERLPSKRGFQGGLGSVDDALGIKRELDTLLDFDPNDVRKISSQGQRLLKGLRVALKEELDEVVPEMKPLNDEYHVFRELYDAVSPQLKDRNIESTIFRLSSGKNKFAFRKLSEINEQLDPEFRFITETLDDLAAQAFAKDPELFSVLPLGISGVAGAAARGAGAGIFTSGLIGTAGGLGAAQLTSGRALAGMLRGAQTFGEGASRMGRFTQPLLGATRPFQGTAVSSGLRLSRSPEPSER